MNNFVFNNASLPVYSGNVDDLCDSVFSAISLFIDENNNPLLFISCDLSDIEVASCYSLQNYCDQLINRNRELADFVIPYIERAIIIDSTFSNSVFSTMIKVGDDTRFSHDCSLKFAFFEDEILISVSDASLWKREAIEFTCIRDDGTCIRKELFNLFSLNISYLPHNISPVSLYNNPDFVRTGRHYNNQPIFKRISEDQYWYKDYFHRDTNPHCEVFDRFGHHLGEGSLTGDDVDYTKACNTKHLTI